MFGLCAVLSVRGDLSSFYRKLCFEFVVSLCFVMFVVPQSQWFVICGVALFYVWCLSAGSPYSVLAQPPRRCALWPFSVAPMYQVLFVLFCPWDWFVRGVVPLFFVWLCALNAFLCGDIGRGSALSSRWLCVIILSVRMLCKLFELFTLPPCTRMSCLTCLSFPMIDVWCFVECKKAKFRKCCLMFACFVFLLWFVDSLLFLLLVPACAVMVSFRTCSHRTAVHADIFHVLVLHFVTFWPSMIMFHRFPWFDFWFCMCILLLACSMLFDLIWFALSLV